jgi:hypothetical protein
MFHLTPRRVPSYPRVAEGGTLLTNYLND